MLSRFLPIASACCLSSLCLFSLATFVSCSPQATAPNHSPTDGVTNDATVGTVDLIVDFGGERPNMAISVPCSADSTVFTILRNARNSTDGTDALSFESSGTGQFVFVSTIEGIKNEQGNGKNWVFRVNGELADRSCGITRVQPGDLVEWTFGAYEPEE